MNYELIENIRTLGKKNLALLLQSFTAEDIAFANRKARALTDEIFGRDVYIRGLIEISNHCKNDCLYCGIRRSNPGVSRFRLSEEQIIACCENGYALGFRTFVLQGGEDLHFTDQRLAEIIGEIKRRFPDCAVTLSLGERSAESYRALFSAGADRYLLRHETASPEHYALLHPASMSFKNRINCLKELKAAGFQTGCGMMVGSPFQTAENLAEDLLFIRSFEPEMVGIGPFIPAAGTPFANKKAGSVQLTLLLISLVRLMLPFALIPSTTALQAMNENGRIFGLNAGANVIMPNLSPEDERKKYILYNNKENAFFDTAAELERIKNQLQSANYRTVTDRGDFKGEKRKV